MKIFLQVVLFSLLVIALCPWAGGRADPAPATSVIPPIVLQGCAPKVKARHFAFFSNGGSASANGRGDQVVGFDVSFVNTSDKEATLVLLRIGQTTFAKTGKFSPNAVNAWRLAAQPGPCSIQAVRFADGTEWAAPRDENSNATPQP